MITEKQLKESAEVENIKCWGVEIPRKPFNESFILMENNELSELLGFMKLNSIKNLFYFFTYYDESLFEIDEEMTKKLGDDVFTLLSNAIREYNEFTQTLDFSRPLGLYIFCLYEGHYIGITDYDDWCEDMGIPTAEEKLMELHDDNYELIEKKQHENDEKENLLREEFKQFVLTDDAFKRCTNQKLRRDYMYLVFNREEAKKYKPLFFYDNRMLNIPITLSFIEMLWREYKG